MYSVPTIEYGTFISSMCVILEIVVIHLYKIRACLGFSEDKVFNTNSYKNSCVETQEFL